MTRRLPFALVALFAVVGTIASLAYAINAWQVYGFARFVWHLPLTLCFGAAVVADALSLSGLFATYLLRNAPRRVRAYAWCVFLGMTGLSIAAAESFASWRRLPVAQQANGEAMSAQIAAGAIVVALAFATHLLIVAKRHVAPTEVVDTAEAVAAAGVPVEVRATGRQAGVYRAMGSDTSRPLYIGSTVDLAARIRGHKAQSDWFPEVVSWVFEPYPTIEDALVAESSLVEAENPVHNKELRGGYREPRSTPMLKGVVVSTVSPSVDVAKVRANPLPRGARRVSLGSGEDARTVAAKRVVDRGERAADVAQEIGKSKRSVELWAQALREERATSRVEIDEPQINGHALTPGAAVEAQVN